MNSASIAATTHEPVKGNPSASMLRTFRRLQLFNRLRQPVLLRAIELDGNLVRFSSASWEEYWADIPTTFRSYVRNLKKTWRAYIDSDFASSEAEPYCSAYLDLLRVVVECKDKTSPHYKAILGRALGFENFVLKYRHNLSAFAAATTSFRNPGFLSLRQLGLRKNSRNDPHLLPLVVATSPEAPILFYHYRKQRILKNCDDSLLFFPVVNVEDRPASFRGLDALTGNLVSAWDSRIEERSRMLARKILVPLLTKTSDETNQRKAKALSILDIGSGVGLFTSKLISKILQAGVLGNRKIELSLLDMLTVDPKRHFSTATLIHGLAKVEYISEDYIRWLSGASSNCGEKFDLVFLFRILHNLSRFSIGMVEQDAMKPEFARNRYPVFEHMSDYYQAISMLFPQLSNQHVQEPRATSVFVPQRVFNPLSLVMPGGGSMIDRLCEIANDILIEDGDLGPDVLSNHIAENVKSHIRVYDLSRALRLSVNHIYWITKSQSDPQLPGALIWPR